MLDAPVATVDLAAVAHNLARVRSGIPPTTQVLAAVKAGAYGHGAVPVARRLQSEGVGWFGVATAREALELREGGIDRDILIFGPVTAHVPALVEAGVSLTVPGIRALRAIEAAGAAGEARVHLKVDTGMGRLGAASHDALEVARSVDASRHARLEAVWTHFACADEPGAAANAAQLQRFHAVLAALARDEIPVPLRHAANSAAALSLPEAAFDLVRPGIALFGYAPSRAVAALEPDLRPAMTLMAPVTFVKRVGRGTPVSYGHTHVTSRATTLATVRCGYADGYFRSLSNVAEASLRGRRVRVVGRVCMDQLLVDAGDLDVAVGDAVELFGPDGPTAADLAERIGTIPYEILTAVGGRVERRYASG